MEDNAKPSEVKRGEGGRFIVPPVSPGRPKGSRNKLGEAFLADMLADWEANGVETIARVREDKPDQYLRVVASVLPKELNVRVNDFDDLTDDELARQLAAIASQLARAGIDIGAGSGSSPPQEPTSSLPAIH